VGQQPAEVGQTFGQGPGLLFILLFELCHV
jgi:hypothetical protein